MQFIRNALIKSNTYLFNSKKHLLKLLFNIGKNDTILIFTFCRRNLDWINRNENSNPLFVQWIYILHIYNFMIQVNIYDKFINIYNYRLEHIYNIHMYNIITYYKQLKHLIYFVYTAQILLTYNLVTEQYINACTIY